MDEELGEAVRSCRHAGGFLHNQQIGQFFFSFASSGRRYSKKGVSIFAEKRRVGVVNS